MTIVLNATPGTLRPFREMESFIELHTFITRFFTRGAFLNNDAYMCFRARRRIHLKQQMAPYGKEFHSMVKQVLSLLRQGIYPGIVEDPIYWHSGLQGANSDARASATACDRGWGVFVMGITTGDHGMPRLEKL